jgi:hypothetical protein
MSKNRGKSKLSNVLFNANKHVFHCEKSLGTLFYGQPRITRVAGRWRFTGVHPHCIGAPIILGRCPSLSVRVSLCYELTSSAERNRREREREKQAYGKVSEAHSSLTTAILLPQRLKQNSVTAHAHQSDSKTCI